MSQTILLVEDDVELAEMIRDFLSDEGFIVDHVDNGSCAIDRILSDKPDLVLLDIMLPGTHGIEVARQVRPQYQGIIIMLTAKDDDISEVNALNRGADGFLEKPVRPHVLLAHIKAQLRRKNNPVTDNPDTVVKHGLSFDFGRQEAYLDGELLDLTTAELQLLAYFMDHTGTVISRENLYEDLRNIEYDGVDRAMDMRISILRKKMNDESPPYRYIKTIRGRGYMLAK